DAPSDEMSDIACQHIIADRVQPAENARRPMLLGVLDERRHQPRAAAGAGETIDRTWTIDQASDVGWKSCRQFFLPAFQFAIGPLRKRDRVMVHEALSFEQATRGTDHMKPMPRLGLFRQQSFA